MTEKRRSPDAAWNSYWLIERPVEGRAHPTYWKESAVVVGLGEWTDDPWQATRYGSQEEGERELRRWFAHPTVPDAKVVSHGFMFRLEPREIAREALTRG